MASTPSDAANLSRSASPGSPSSPRLRHSRIHFPVVPVDPSQAPSSTFKPLDPKDLLPSPTNTAHPDHVTERRRVHSTGAPNDPFAYSRAQHVAGPSNLRTASRRTASYTLETPRIPNRADLALPASPLRNAHMKLPDDDVEGISSLLTLVSAC